MRNQVKINVTAFGKKYGTTHRVSNFLAHHVPKEAIVYNAMVLFTQKLKEEFEAQLSLPAKPGSGNTKTTSKKGKK